MIDLPFIEKKKTDQDYSQFFAPVLALYLFGPHLQRNKKYI